MDENKEKTNNEEDAILLDHDYDGIQEYDYPLPSWWTGLFYLTVIFSVGYFVYYQFAGGPTLSQELFDELQMIEAMKPVVDEEELEFKPDYFAEIKEDSKAMEYAHKVFLAKCATCHTKTGGGDIGPNLTDKTWIHGEGDAPFIRETVREGRPVEGMPSWKSILKKKDIYSVTAHVRSLRNTNVSGGKRAQGQKIVE